MRAEQREAVRAEVLRRFLHGGVDVGERGREVEQDEREIVQRLDEDDAVQPLHERDAEAEPVVEQQVDRAVAAVDELHRHRADERRHHQRHHAERVDQRRAAEIGSAPGWWRAAPRSGSPPRPSWRRRRSNSRTPRAAAPVRKKSPKWTRVKPPSRPGEGDDDHAHDRHDQEGDQEQRHDDERGDLRRAGAVAGERTVRARSATIAGDALASGCGDAIARSRHGRTPRSAVTRSALLRGQRLLRQRLGLGVVLHRERRPISPRTRPGGRRPSGPA